MCTKIDFQHQQNPKIDFSFSVRCILIVFQHLWNPKIDTSFYIACMVIDFTHLQLLDLSFYVFQKSFLWCSSTKSLSNKQVGWNGAQETYESSLDKGTKLSTQQHKLFGNLKCYKMVQKMFTGSSIWSKKFQKQWQIPFFMDSLFHNAVSQCSVLTCMHNVPKGIEVKSNVSACLYSGFSDHERKTKKSIPFVFHL